jgi:hypothetical protein
MLNQLHKNQTNHWHKDQRRKRKLKNHHLMEDYQKDQQLQNHPQNKLLPPTQKKPFVEKKRDADLPPAEAAEKKEKEAEEIEKKNAGDMGSTAATWAGSGAPP